MIGADRGDMARKIDKFLGHRMGRLRSDTAWMPQVPDDFDALTMVSLMGGRSNRIELGTAVVPLQAQHPIALARQAFRARGHRRPTGAGCRAVAPLDHPRHARLPYEKPAAYTRDYLEVLNTAIAGPGPVDVENDTFTVHNPTVLGAESRDAGAGGCTRSGDAADRRRDGRRHRAVDGRRTRHRGPHRTAITKAADNAGAARHRGSSPASRSACARPVARSTRRRTGPTGYWRGRDVAELSDGCSTAVMPAASATVTAAGDQATILAWVPRYADAGATDLSVRLLPIGDTRDELVASKYRTRGDRRSWPGDAMSAAAPLAGIRSSRSAPCWPARTPP